jgi:hypothetical protein
MFEINPSNYVRNKFVKSTPGGCRAFLRVGQDRPDAAAGVNNLTAVEQLSRP